jgi:hypothetical protein
MTLKPPVITSMGKQVLYDGVHFADAATPHGAELIAAGVAAHLSAEPMPMLTFTEADRVGHMLHEHWEKMADEAPMLPDDLGWADIVQFVAREARGLVRERQRKAHGHDR